MDIETIRTLILQGRSLVKAHAFHHAVKEGFAPEHIEAAVLSGRILEQYPARRRALVCGRVVIDTVAVYLHVVCELNPHGQVDLVTAYIPDPVRWETSPFRRRRR
ncbi:MAG: DUF4258 domain-containing protein [Chloroflexi bacterium]|nr:DUF4258 domain-containing protein [Chloroflexota bacterium]